jgi:hypothetical protein
MAQTQKQEKSAEELAANQPQPSVQPTEPEDASKAGSHAAGQKQALHESVKRSDRQQHPESVAGQHATGSFTDPDEKQ